MHNIDSVNYEKQKAKYIDYNKIDENLAWKDYESAQKL